jgi:putative ABC transport system permease protein
MTWPTLIWRNLLRRPARTAFTAIGVGLGVSLIIALLAISNGVQQTAAELTHVGGADFGLYQQNVSDFTQSLLPDSLAHEVAREPGVASVARIKLLIVGGTLVFGLDPHEFAARRLVIVSGRRGSGLLAGVHSGLHLGQGLTLRTPAGRRSYTVEGIYASGDRYEDLGVVLPLPTVEALAGRPGEVTSLGVTVTPDTNIKSVAHRLEARFPGVTAITEPGQAIKVDTSSRLIVSTGWIVSLFALIVGGIGVTNTMAMSVFERTREIGVLRAVGWTVPRIGAMILSEAVGICLLALGVGCGLGVLAAQVFVARSQLSGLISPHYTAGTFGWGLAFALGVGVVGALYPTWRAIRLAPVAALRHE